MCSLIFLFCFFSYLINLTGLVTPKIALSSIKNHSSSSKKDKLLDQFLIRHNLNLRNFQLEFSQALKL